MEKGFTYNELNINEREEVKLYNIYRPYNRRVVSTMNKGIIAMEIETTKNSLELITREKNCLDSYIEWGLADEDEKTLYNYAIKMCESDLAFLKSLIAEETAVETDDVISNEEDVDSLQVEETSDINDDELDNLVIESIESNDADYDDVVISSSRTDAIERNTKYLVNRINAGKTVSNGYIFTMPSSLSKDPANGLLVHVDFLTGEVDTLDMITDELVEKLESNEERGYVTTQLALPWMVENDKKNYMCGTSEYTCYLHRIAGICKQVSLGRDVCLTDDVNHINGHKSDNSSGNLEMCESKWNIIHGYFLELLYYLNGYTLAGKRIDILTDKKGRKYLSTGISADVIKMLYCFNNSFKDYIDDCWKNKHSRKKERKEKLLDKRALDILSNNISYCGDRFINCF